MTYLSLIQWRCWNANLWLFTRYRKVHFAIFELEFFHFLLITAFWTSTHSRLRLIMNLSSATRRQLLIGNRKECQLRVTRFCARCCLLNFFRCFFLWSLMHTMIFALNPSKLDWNSRSSQAHRHHDLIYIIATPNDGFLYFLIALESFYSFCLHSFLDISQI